MSYCSDTPEEKDTSCVEHVIAVMRPCLRGLVDMDSTRDLPECDKNAGTDHACQRRICWIDVKG